MIIGGSDGYYVAQSIRNHGLAAIVAVPTLVAAPGNNGSILLQRQTVILCRRDGHHIAQARRYGGLAVRVQPPSHDRAVLLKCQTVMASRRDGHNVAQPGGNIG